MKKIIAMLMAGFTIAATCNISIAADKAASKDEQSAIIAKLQQRFPQTHVDSIRKAELGSLYEVRMGDNIAYVDKDVNYFIYGHIFDIATRQDLTQARINEFDKVDFAKLPFQDAIKIKKGNGKRVFAAFTDPECPFCQRLEGAMSSMDNYTMYVFLFPIAQLHPASMAKATAIWCSKDRAKAYHDALTVGIDETKVKPCTTPINDIIAYGNTLKVAGTPTLIRSDGVKMPGFAPADRLNAWLDQAAKANVSSR